MGPDGIHPRGLRELADGICSLISLSIIFEQSWIIREVPVDCKLADVLPIYTKGWKG